MAMHTETLTTSWYQFTELDDDRFVTLQLAGDDCDVITAAEEPDTNATAFTISAGISRLDIPDGHSLWIRCPSGTCDLTYSQFGGVLFDDTKSIHAWDGGADQGFQQTPAVFVGHDDSQTDPYTWVGLMESFPAGISSAATINSARLLLQLTTKFYPGKQFRIHGVASAESVSGDVDSYLYLASGVTVTTEFVDFTVGHSGAEMLDITDIVQELVGVGGWDVTSPIQLRIVPNDSLTTGVDATTSIRVSASSAVFVNAS